MIRRWSLWSGLLVLLASTGCMPSPPGYLSDTKGLIALQASPAYRIHQVAHRVLLDNPEPPPFDWGEGVLMAGMMHAGTTLHEPRYLDFVRAWADHWREAGVAALLEGPPDRPMKGYCGQWGPGYALILLHEHTGDSAYLDMAREIAAFIQNQATRTGDGGLGHWRGNQQLWVDTLWMTCPVLAPLAKIDNRPELMDGAVHQLKVYSQHLQNEQSGLFYHMYDDSVGDRSDFFWARGNGWTAMSYVEVLRRLDPSLAAYEPLRRDYLRLLDGFLKTQDPDTGLWHTILDKPETYVESSASAMILYSMIETERLGLITGRTLVERAADAWSGLNARVSSGGHFVDVSGGTRPGSFEEYAGKVRGTYTWGTGAFLMAACALETTDR